VAVVRCLIKEYGVDVHKADMEGVSPVFMAINNGHMAVARCLVNECGADVNQADTKGFAPLYRAA
jgi:ankyrin repeat protein